MQSQTATAATTLPAGRVGGDGGNILNAANLDAGTGQGAQSGLGARAGGLGAVAASGAELDVQGVDTELLAAHGNVLSGKHCRVRGRLIAIGLHLHPAGHADQSFLARQISHVDEGVVERSEDVSDAPDELTLPAKCAPESKKQPRKKQSIYYEKVPLAENCPHALSAKCSRFLKIYIKYFLFICCVAHLVAGPRLTFSSCEVLLLGAMVQVVALIAKERYVVAGHGRGLHNSGRMKEGGPGGLAEPLKPAAPAGPGDKCGELRAKSPCN